MKHVQFSLGSFISEKSGQYDFFFELGKFNGSIPFLQNYLFDPRMTQNDLLTTESINLIPNLASPSNLAPKYMYNAGTMLSIPDLTF